MRWCAQSAVACIDSKANVCSVQFSPTNSNLMAFGSANYRVYLYDLRNIQVSRDRLVSRFVMLSESSVFGCATMLRMLEQSMLLCRIKHCLVGFALHDAVHDAVRGSLGEG